MLPFQAAWGERAWGGGGSGGGLGPRTGGAFLIAAAVLCWVGTRVGWGGGAFGSMYGWRMLGTSTRASAGVCLA